MSDRAAAALLVSDRAERTLRLLSVVAPMHDEAAVVKLFHERVCKALEGVTFELIIVDDASEDDTFELLERIAGQDLRLRIVRLSRSFGHQAALTAGLDQARGDVVVMLDGDLQDPPEVIPEMLEHWRAGVDVVYGVRDHREGETRFKLATAHWFYRLFAWVTRLDLPADAGDFRLLDRAALDALGSMRERNRFLRGMTVWIGFTQVGVRYQRDARPAGETKFTLPKMLRFSADALISFSQAPLQAATIFGFICAVIAFISLPLVVVARYAGIYVPGISSILFVVLLLGGIQLITLGIVGEYVGRIHDEVKGRPLYLVRETRNAVGTNDDDSPPPAAPPAQAPSVGVR